MRYNTRVAGTLGVTTTAMATIIAGAVRSFLIVELDFQGMGTASLADELGFYRVGTAGTTGSSAMTFGHPGTASSPPSFTGTGFLAYSTQPIAGELVFNFGLNANGQRYIWRAKDIDDAISVPGGNNAAGSIALFPISGSATFIGRIGVIEL